jgi:hypothetical protein
MVVHILTCKKCGTEFSFNPSAEDLISFNEELKYHSTICKGV